MISEGYNYSFLISNTDQSDKAEKHWVSLKLFLFPFRGCLKIFIPGRPKKYYEILTVPWPSMNQFDKINALSFIIHYFLGSLCQKTLNRKYLQQIKNLKPILCYLFRHLFVIKVFQNYMFFVVYIDNRTNGLTTFFLNFF